MVVQKKQINTGLAREHVSFGDYITQQRVKKRLRFDDVAEYLSISGATLTGGYVGNKKVPKANRMSLLANLLELDVVYLSALGDRIETEIKFKILCLLKFNSCID